MYEEQSKYADAEPLFQRAIHIQQRALGPNHPSVANTINNLAELGTGEEVSAIADLLQGKGWKTGIYTRDLALKRLVESANSPLVVHLATHGFFPPISS